MKKTFLIIALSLVTAYGREYPRDFSGYFSQRGQDKFLNEKIFKEKRDGVFIEVGAHDGISFSNTYFFEKSLGWSGICVEPNPDIFKKLIANRACNCENVCITDIIGQMPFLKCTGYMLEMYSGLLNNYDPRHIERIDNEIALYGGDKETIVVDCISFKELFKKYDLSHIDLLSIDIEGGEEAAIKTIDFDTIKIDIIVIENNFNEDTVKKYLISKGYQLIERLGKDDIYQLKDARE